MRKFYLATVAALLLSLTACGNTAQERMISGGLIGAGTGALLGGLTTPQPAPHYRGR